jgi:uncharacterized protein (UPF0548 family)
MFLDVSSREGSEHKIRQFLARQAESRLSYSAVGAIADEVVPPGFEADHNRIQLGSGELGWKRAVAALNQLQDVSAWLGAPLLA